MAVASNYLDIEVFMISPSFADRLEEVAHFEEHTTLAASLVVALRSIGLVVAQRTRPFVAVVPHSKLAVVELDTVQLV